MIFTDKDWIANKKREVQKMVLLFGDQATDWDMYIAMRILEDREREIRKLKTLLNQKDEV